ncbi:MAG: hypothetical protein ACJ76S_07295 [Solirubrobacteraceae bacterium]
MSNEDRQRILRRAGSQPAEAETRTRARDSREATRREDAELEGEEPPGEPESQPAPLAEDSEGPPRPRR